MSYISYSNSSNRDKINLSVNEIASQITQFTKKYDLKSKQPIISSQKASVYKLRRKFREQNQDSQIAIKILCRTLPTFSNILHQVQILTQLNQLQHKNIIELYDVYVKDIDNNQYIVMCLQLCSQNLLNKTPNQSNEGNRTKILNLIEQIVDGMYYIHTKNIFHMDLKPDNIMIKKDVLKIIDFGQSLKKPYIRSDQHLVSQKYCPPQILQILIMNNSVTIQYKSTYDVWSFGMILHQMLLKSNGKELDELIREFDSSDRQISGIKTNSSTKDRKHGLLKTEQIIKYGRHLIEQWEHKTNQERNQKESLFFKILKIIFVQESRRCNFADIQNLILSFNKSNKRSVTSNKLKFGQLEKCFSSPKNVNSVKSNILTNANSQVLVFLNYLSMRVDMLNQLLEYVLEPANVLLERITKRQKLIFQYVFIGMLYQEWKYLIGLHRKDSIILPNNQIILMNNNSNITQYHVYQKDILPYFQVKKQQYEQFMMLIDPVFMHFKKVLGNLNDYKSVDEQLEYKIRSSESIESMFTIEKGEQFIMKLLKKIFQRIEMNRLEKYDTLMFCRLSFVGRFNSYFNKNRYLSKENFEEYKVLNVERKKTLETILEKNLCEQIDRIVG